MAWKNLIGQQFGNLIVIDQDTDYIFPSTGRLVPRWKCKCECGHVFTVINNNLTNGRIPKCPKCKSNAFKDLTGQKFGKLIVIRRASDYESKDGKEVQWVCKCICGNPEEITVTRSHLITGHTKSCGCLKTGIDSNINEEINTLNIETLVVPYGTQIQPNSVQGVSFVVNEENTIYKQELDTKLKEATQEYMSSH